MEELPSQVRERILAEHHTLRGILERVEVLSRAVLQGKTGAALELRRQAFALDERLRAHMADEERCLVPVLREADPWGPQRVERFHEEHDRQRRIMDQIWRVRASSRSGDATEFALIAWGFVRLLYEDMAEEEKISLNERVMRDDPIEPLIETD